MGKLFSPTPKKQTKPVKKQVSETSLQMAVTCWSEPKPNAVKGKCLLCHWKAMLTLMNTKLTRGEHYPQAKKKSATSKTDAKSKKITKGKPSRKSGKSKELPKPKRVRY